MKTQEVVEGTWQVAHRLGLLGRLTLEGSTWQFTQRAGLTLPADALRFVPFIARPTGTFTVFYPPPAHAATTLDELPRPPTDGGYLQELSIARVQFVSPISTNAFRITVDLDCRTARFHADFHSMLTNDPCRVTRALV